MSAERCPLISEIVLFALAQHERAVRVRPQARVRENLPSRSIAVKRLQIGPLPGLRVTNECQHDVRKERPAAVERLAGTVTKPFARRHDSMTVSKAASECLSSLGKLSVSTCKSLTLAKFREGFQILCQTASYCNAKLVETTIPFTVANRVVHTLRFGKRQGCIPCRPVRELLDDALSVFGQAAVIETKDVNRGAGFGSIADCLNLTIKLESKELFACRLKRRYEFGAVVFPPIIL